MELGELGEVSFGILWLGEVGLSKLQNVRVGLGEFGETILSKKILYQEAILYSLGILCP